jgi:glycosyltransferase involved in cell wall biosynthesis
MIKLSIIIPAYNAEPYIHELINCLEPQVIFRNDIQVVVVDDGSTNPLKIEKPWVEFHKHNANKGISAARNTGMKYAKGKYIQFIDADDLVAENFIEYVIHKIDAENFDYMLLSWKSLKGGMQFDIKLNDNNSELPPMNVSACTRTYKASFIGDVRFNEKKSASEDEEFNRKLDFKNGRKSVATEYMYFYRTDTPNSNSKRFLAGETGMQRIVYYYKHVTADMTDLIDEFKKADEYAEVMLLTNKNDIPELGKYCRIYKPMHIKATEKRGEPCDFIEIMPQPIITQVVIYASWLEIIGGIETFTYAFVRRLSKYYDIIVICDSMDELQIRRLEEYVRVMKNDLTTTIICDTLIMNRVIDKIPENIKYGKSVQMVHGNVFPNYKLPTDRQETVCVSETVKKSWGKATSDARVIQNMTFIEEQERPLLLVSATRIDTSDKGGDRMFKFAKLLKDQGIDFVWLVFTNRDLPRYVPANMIKMPPTQNVLKYIQMADYLVQLSGAEGFGYSIVEALTLGTPVIVTPLPVLSELGFKDKVNGYVVPFDLTDDLDVTFIKDIPSFDYEYNNEPLIKAWRKLLGNTTPKGDYDINKVYTNVRVTKRYHDNALNKDLEIGEVHRMRNERAKLVIDKGYGEACDNKNA